MNLIDDTIERFHLRTYLTGVIPFFMLAHFGHHVLTALTVPLLPFVRNDFALDYTSSGLMISAFSLAYGIGQLPAGWLADRVGARIVITIGISGVALAGIFVGLSPNYIMLIVFLALMGLAGGGYHPAAAPLISMSVAKKNLGRALGFHIIGGSASFFLAPLIGVAIASAWGWRGTYIGLAVPAFFFGIIFYFTVNRLQNRQKKTPMPAKGSDGKDTAQFRRRRLAAFIILSTFSGAVIASVIAFVPLFLVDHFGVSKKTAGFFLSLIYSTGLWAAPLGGYLSDRIGRVRMILAMSLMLGPVIYLLNIVPYGIGFGALLLALGMILMMRMPIAEAYIVSQAPGHLRSTILGIYYFCVIEGGGVLTPVVGYLIDQFGFQISFTISGATVVVGTFICSLFLIRIRTNKSPRLYI